MPIILRWKPVMLKGGGGRRPASTFSSPAFQPVPVIRRCLSATTARRRLRTVEFIGARDGAALPLAHARSSPCAPAALQRPVSSPAFPTSTPARTTSIDASPSSSARGLWTDPIDLLRPGFLSGGTQPKHGGSDEKRDCHTAPSAPRSSLSSSRSQQPSPCGTGGPGCRAACSVRRRRRARRAAARPARACRLPQHDDAHASRCLR